jgi:hypothetical protein
MRFALDPIDDEFTSALMAKVLLRF